MSLPRQVEEAADLAEQLHGRMFNPDPQEDEGVQQGEEASDEDLESTSEEESVEQDEEADVPHDDDLDELRKFKARYLSLKGKYDSEVPRLHQDLKELKQSVFEKLEQTVAQKQVTQAAPVEDKVGQYFSEYGEDFVENLKMLIQAEAEAKIRESIKPVQEQVLSVEDTQTKAAQQSFMGYLDETVKGDWKALWEGNDPKFIEFLQSPDPSGLYTYGDLVQQYNNNWDADRLSKVFNLYIDASHPAKPAKQEAPNPAKTAMVAPSRNTQHATPAASDKLTWTGETIKEFQMNDRRGKYTPEVSKQMWDDLLSAMAENRIR